MTGKEAMQVIETYSKVHPIQRIDMFKAYFYNVRVEFMDKQGSSRMYHVFSEKGELVGKLRVLDNLIAIAQRIDEDWSRIILYNEDYDYQFAFEYIPNHVVEHIAEVVW